MSIQFKSLSVLAQEKEIPIKFGITTDRYNVDTTISQIIKYAFDYTNPENQMKMNYLRTNTIPAGSTYSSSNTFNFTYIDNRCKYAKDNLLNIRWHVAVYGKNVPQFLKDMDTAGTLDSNVMSNFLSNHITTIFNYVNSNYGNIITSMDVANEIIHSENSSNIFYKYLGNNASQLVNTVFTIALNNIPPSNNIKLYLNDYGLENNLSNLNNLISIAPNSLVNGIGFQTHIRVTNAIDTSSSGFLHNFERNLNHAMNSGYDIQLTELDMNCDIGSNLADKFHKQAQGYSNILKIALNQGVELINIWGFKDDQSWRGASNYPLLFDSNYNPKPAYYALLNVLSNYNPSDYGSGNYLY